MMEVANKHLTLEKLENCVWTDVEFESNLVKRCHALRKIPINKLSVEDLRLLIGQQIGLKFILEIALDRLSGDVLAEGDFYPGDLLTNVLEIDKNYWVENKDQWIRLDKIIKENQGKLDSLEINIEKFYK